MRNVEGLPIDLEKISVQTKFKRIFCLKFNASIKWSCSNFYIFIISPPIHMLVPNCFLAVVTKSHAYIHDYGKSARISSFLIKNIVASALF